MSPINNLDLLVQPPHARDLTLARAYFSEQLLQSRDMPALARKRVQCGTESGTLTSTTASAELAYEQSKAAIHLLAKEEELRKARLEILLLGDDQHNLDDSLLREADRADHAEREADEWRCASKQLETDLDLVRIELRSKTKEWEVLKAEINSLQSTSDDSSKLLIEKLALTRELATLKPEILHLRSQAATNDNILSEKLGLQRHVALLQAQLEDAQHKSSHLQEQIGKGAGADAALQDELEEQRDLLVEERKARARTEKSMSTAFQDEISSLRTELASEKSRLETAQRSIAEAKSQDDTQVISELAKVKSDLAAERKERLKIEKVHAKSIADFSAQKELLDEKLDQFRAKLRSTKENLKSTQEELALVREQAAASQGPRTAAAGRTANSRKRPAVTDPDATIGTPGDGPTGHPAKRNKRASSLVSTIGEKSTFSITPMLNRTKNVLPDRAQSVILRGSHAVLKQHDPDEPMPSIEPASAAMSEVDGDAVDEDQGDGDGSEERVSSTTATIATNKAKKPQPLGPASPGKANLTAKSRTKSTSSGGSDGRRKVAKASKLDMVVEEPGSPNENNAGTVEVLAEAASPPQESEQKPSLSAKPRLSLKPKSLSSFATFREGSLQAPPLGTHDGFGQQKRKRKLGGGPRTIFDEDAEDDDGAGLGIGRMGAFATGGQRPFGALGAAARSFSLLAAKAKSKGPLVTMADGFAFSPLRKERRG